ncbi:CatB-related O-acetyltransferase [uncultured Croceitalea sp.]|uniref:CatB-related O-acetyltransferase n=1 Tax=uncultured Croceitalea sp. TaxID=1798908 RepID=UPI0033058CC0
MVSFFLRNYRKLFKKNNAIRFGAEVKNTVLGSNINISRYCFVSNSVIGNYSSLGRNTTVINAEIGNFCSISWNSTIGATSHDYKRLTTHAFPYISHYNFVKKDERFIIKTTLGNDVWIGANVIIMPGVKVGNGAVIGAGSIVTKDVDDFEIVYGIPAKSKGFRFSKQTIEEITEMAWWNWDDGKLKKHIGIFKEPYEQTGA